ncbi:sulfotransferase domain-containing protein [Gemmatimonadota bacterium]
MGIIGRILKNPKSILSVGDNLLRGRYNIFSEVRNLLLYFYHLRIKKFCDETPILLCTHQKSGTHWLMFIIYNYFNILKNGAQETLTYDEVHRLQHHKPKYDDPSVFVPPEPGFPLFFHTHNAYTPVFMFFKVIHLYRNPLDTLISDWHFNKNRAEPFHKFPGMQEKYMDLDFFVRDRLSKWIWHYNKTVGHADVLISYEAMKKNVFAEMQRLFNDLQIECDGGILQQSIEMSSFTNIKKMGQKTGTQSGGGELIKKHTGEFTRSGEMKQYLSLLSEETLVYARQMLKANNIELDI